MACCERNIAASPEAVFNVLADPRGYAYWVIGSIEIRGADAHWPGRGSRFQHTVGFGPLRVQDYSVVEDVELNRFLQLETKARPLGNARVKLELTPADGGTLVKMVEDPADTPTAFLFMPLTHLLMRGRNVRSLDRLAELAEGRRSIPGDEAGAPVATLDGGAVQNPAARERRGGRTPLVAGAVALGAAAGALAALRAARRRG